MELKRFIRIFLTALAIMSSVVAMSRDYLFPGAEVKYDNAVTVISSRMAGDEATPANDNIPPDLTQRARAHILYGDERGGGHLYGMGKPCKSEFPRAWSAERIINTARTVAANDNIDWRRGENGLHAGEETIEGVRVRVVVDRENNRIITAYPTNLPRNACP